MMVIFQFVLLIFSLFSRTTQIQRDGQCSDSVKELRRSLNRKSKGSTAYPIISQLVVISNRSSDDIAEIDTINKFFDVILWSIGPFSLELYCITSDDLFSISETNNDLDNTLSSIKNQLNGKISAFLFDNISNSSSYYNVPFSLITKPTKMKRFLEDRYLMKVEFSLSNTLNNDLEIQWIDIRGNTRMYRLGLSGLPLVITPGGNSVIQTTRGGSLYVVLRTENTKILNGNKNINGVVDGASVYQYGTDKFLSYFPFERIEGVYFIPAVFCLNNENIKILIKPHNMDANNTLNSFLPFSWDCSSYHSMQNCYRDIILKYWEMQRVSQVQVQTWAVPSLYTIQKTGKLETEPSINGEMFEREKELNKLSNNFTNKLWKKVRLPRNLTKEIEKYHWENRCDVDIARDESFISMVFNQHEVPTRYVPLPNSLLNQVTEIIQTFSAAWLGMSTYALEVSSMYGVREYGPKALLRWHVDPAESQPITAIVHVAHSFNPPDDTSIEAYFNCKTPRRDTRGKENKEEDWTIQVPKDLNFRKGRENVENVSFVKGLNSLNLNSIPALVNVSFDELMNISLEPGEVLLIQSAKMPHARIKPLNGEWYANLFVHFFPRHWNKKPEIIELI